MTDRIQALEALRDNIKAGHCEFSYFEAVFVPPNSFRAEGAFLGSLDAALALHNAVLPEWAWAEIRISTRPKVSLGYDAIEVDAQDAILSRAWLLSIIEALISETHKGDTP